MYNAMAGEMTHVYAGLGKKLGSGSALGLLVSYVTSGDMATVDPLGNETGSFSVNSTVIGLSYAMPLGESTGLGITLKSVMESIATESGSGMAADIGILYRAGEKTKLGLVVQNAGTGMTYQGDDTVYQFPAGVRAGISYAVTNEAEKGLIVAADVSKVSSDNSVGFGAGGEYRVGNLSLRAGVEQAGESIVPGLGIGINAGNFLIDIGGGMHPDLGNTLKVSLAVKFGAAGLDK